MQPAQPIQVQPLFEQLNAALMALLRSLTPAQWGAPTACEGWSVQDLAAHLLADDLGVLSRVRDGHTPPVPDVDFSDYAQLVAFINHSNAVWVEAARRLSPAIVLDLLAYSGPKIVEYYNSLDPQALGGPVNWAGPDPAPVWLDLAREYTERWLHQQQIREAVGAPGLDSAEYMRPLLDTFCRALPHNYRDVQAQEGTTISLEIEELVGGAWTVRRDAEKWALYQGRPETPSTLVQMSPQTAWKMFTKGMSLEEARQAARVSGEKKLAEALFGTVAILA